MSEPDKFEDKLKKEVLRHGFPLEIEIQSILEDKDWAVFPTNFYIDPQTGKQREVDILSIHPQTGHSEETNPIGFSPNLIIECKKSSEYCAILFSRKTIAFTLYDFTGQMFDFPFLLKERTGFTNPVKEFNLGHFLADRQLHFNKLKKVATLFPMLKPGGREKRDLYQAIMQLVKAQSFEVKNAIRRSPTIRHSFHPLYFSFLAVVFDGLMFEAAIENGEIKLTPIDHGLVQKSFQPDYDYFGGPLRYTIDVMNKGYFSKYLSEVENDLKVITNKIKLNIDEVSKYLKRPSVQFR
jgi:hypothetical protein